MKRVLFALMLGSVAASAQNVNSSKVPLPVKDAFNKNFSGIKEVKWEKEKGNYEANFIQNKQKLSAEIEEAGIDPQLRADNFETFSR